METYSEYQRDNKRAVIVERNKKYEIDFYDDTSNTAKYTIRYEDKNIRFVEDAAWNYCTGILTEETINRYKIRWA